MFLFLTQSALGTTVPIDSVFVYKCWNFYFCNFQEPTSSVAPKVTGGRLQEKTLDFGQAGTVLCLSQGYPVPNIRRVSSLAERLNV